MSSVATDWLYSGKPFALTNMLGEAAEAFETSFPLSRAAYIVDRDAANLKAVLDDMFSTDSLEALRREVKAYYLGDFDEADYADGFVRAARSYVDGPAAGLRTDDRPDALGVMEDAVG